MQTKTLKNLPWEDINIKGVLYKTLRLNEGAGAGGTTLVAMEKGSSYPPHRHPGREQALVLKGRLRVGDITLDAGDYWVVESGEVHDAEALEDTEFLVVTDQTVQLL
ncbi:cupin domain-containing protein [Kordiimonas marina]|uniref:cupin domain-containing protein n=1 Tax=Kordiimonas marina TaxID=2872312 RepID=UPI001FF308C6|nr:cupin domain-containing protein [Kordiimonas marina]MCJ9428639.1 cupin domain-containing protein [Kordiimonas marina]